MRSHAITDEDVERLLEEVNELLSEYVDEYGNIDTRDEVVAGSTLVGPPDEHNSTGGSKRVLFDFLYEGARVMCKFLHESSQTQRTEEKETKRAAGASTQRRNWGQATGTEQQREGTQRKSSE